MDSDKRERPENRVGWASAGRIALIAVGLALLVFAVFSALNAHFGFVEWRPF